MKRIGIVLVLIILNLGNAFAAKVAHGPFPDFGYLPTKSEYSGPLFLLSQDYPKQAPRTLPGFFKLLPVNRTHKFSNWQKYVKAVRDYCLAGNASVNWDVQRNTVRHWYHMPWQHFGPHGREGIHGLTKEAPVEPQQLAMSQHSKGQTYAVGIFNAQGGYTIGQVWKNSMDPDLTITSKPHSFANGTVICKALFVTNPPSEVPSLKDQPLQWQAYVTTSFDSTERVVRKLSLIQMDFAIRDSRIAGTGWLFGTFQYNSEGKKTASWNNLVPVGIMWGNDPGITSDDYTNPHPGKTRINPNLKQSAINPGPELPPTHLGWNGRLDGPVDNPWAACMSCHMTAEYPALSPLNPKFAPEDKRPPIGSKAWMRWFQNIPAGVPFDKGTLSADYSLQLAIAVQNFYDWKCNQGGVFVGGGNACEKYHALRAINAANAHKKVYPIVRNIESH